MEKPKTVNWSKLGTMIFSFLTTLSLIPYSLGEASTIIPPQYKAKLVLASAVAAAGCRLIDGVKNKIKP